VSVSCGCLISGIEGDSGREAHGRSGPTPFAVYCQALFRIARAEKCWADARDNRLDVVAAAGVLLGVVAGAGRVGS
jgi:hypothetical protein